MGKASLETQGGLKVLGAQPEITKYFNNTGTPYTDVSQVLSELPLDIRHQGLVVNIAGVEYHFSGGKADGNLVEKNGLVRSNSTIITKTSSDTWASIFALPYDNFRLKLISYPTGTPDLLKLTEIRTEINGTSTLFSPLGREYEVQRIGRNGLIFQFLEFKWAFTSDDGARKDVSWEESREMFKKKVDDYFQLTDDSNNPILDDEDNPIYTFLTHAEAPLPTVHTFDELSEWNHAGGELIQQLAEERATTEYVDSLIEPMVLSIDNLNASVAGIEDAIDLLADTKFDEDNVINDKSVVAGIDKVWSISAVVGYIANAIQKFYDKINDVQSSADTAQLTADLGSPFDQFAIIDDNGDYIIDGNGDKIYAILNY
jgi:hypothetical protein